MKLALIGVSGVGKDYVADVFNKEYHYVRFSFSDQLKKLGSKIYPWLKPDYSPEEKEKPLNFTIQETGEIITDSPRQIWLKLNALRGIENNLFIRMLDEQIKLVQVENYLISDVRTQNEYDWCKENGFIFIMVKSNTPLHPENSFDDWVRDIENRGLYDYEFTNNFNGTEEIKTFFESCF